MTLYSQNMDLIFSKRQKSIVAMEEKEESTQIVLKDIIMQPFYRMVS